MKKWIALLLALVMSLSLCACGGGDDARDDSDASGKEASSKTEPEAEAAPAAFEIHNGVRFGMTPEEVDALEPNELSMEPDELYGYLCGYLEPEKGDFTDFEGYDDANVFYLFDPESEELQEVMVMLGDYGDSAAWKERYGEMVSLFADRYGAPSELDESAHTYAYNYLVKDDPDRLQLDGEVVDGKMWIVPDEDGSVKIELIKAIIFGDSYITYVGMQHL